MSKISIIIPTCKKEHLQPLLESIHQYTDWPDLEIIVVANGYNGPQEKVNQWLSFPDRIGYTKAINQGLAIAKGEFVILLNDDCLLLSQEKNTWLNILLKPFSDEKVGLTGPVKMYCEYANRDFLIFFLVCIRASLFKELGPLDEIFNPGGGEDTDYCIKAENAGYKVLQVPSNEKHLENGMWITNFPIYHAAEKTVFDIPEWAKIIDSHREILRERYGLPNGAFWPDDIEEYRRLVEQVPDRGSIAELGNAYGRSLCSIADLIKKKNLNVLAVDTYEGTESEKTEEQKKIKENYKDIFVNNLKRYGIENQTRIYQGRTDEVYKNIPNEIFDLIFIDADHIYEAIKQDILNWRPKLKKTGIMAGHDYGGVENRGVKKAVDEVFLRIARKGLVWSEKKGHHISVSLCTMNRYHSTLPMAMMSVALQTRKPDFVYIYDDTPVDKWEDIRNIPEIGYILQLYYRLGIDWYIIYGYKKGQHYGDQEVNVRAKDIVWRIDDDLVAEPNCLEELEKAITNDVGAVGCSIEIPGQFMQGTATGKLENIKSEPNMQWVRGAGEVEHLHSSFLYRSKVANFDLRLSPRSFRGETMFSHEIFRKGYKLKVINSTTIWHLHEQKGGNRSITDDKITQILYAHDEAIFDEQCKIWKKGKKEPIFYLDMGLGDHLIFKKLLDDAGIQEGAIACCYPEVFEGTKFKLLSLTLAQKLGYNPADYDVYVWMDRTGFKGSVYQGFKEFYKL